MITRILPVFFVICFVYNTGCIQDAPFKVNNSTVPEKLNDGWEISTPQNENLDPDSVNKVHMALMDESRYFNALGLLIIKNGKIVFESYPQDQSDRDRVHTIQSATKSMTSLVFGTLVSDGLIDSLDKPLSSYFPDKFPDDSRKQKITIQHLLTMRSGLMIDNSQFSYNMMVEKPHDYLRHLLNLPLYADPGDSFYYRDCDPSITSYLIQKVTGRTEESIAKERIFTPLGITNYYWEQNFEGVTTGGFGLYLLPRDMARIGQMVLQNGKWNGKQLIDSAWIAEAVTVRAHTVWENIVWDYGYFWWILPQYHAFTMCGHGGNFVFVSPDQEMVIVLVSMPDTNDDYVGTSLKRFIELVKPILKFVTQN